MDIMKKKNEESENKLFSEFMEFANEDNNDKNVVANKLKENVEIKKEKIENNVNNNDNNNNNEKKSGDSFADRVKMFSK